MPVRVLYVYGVIAVALILCVFLWFIGYYVFYNLQPAMGVFMHQFENSTSYSSYDLADTFMVNFWTYLPIIMFFGILYWAYIYSQRKGRMME